MRQAAPYEKNDAMAFATLDVKLHPPSGTIILRRPDRKNALNRRAVADLEQAFSDLHQTKSVRAVILAAEGDVFCSGADLVEISKAQQEEDPFEIYREDVAGIQTLLETILRFPKPVIAAIHGPALGWGAALALSCDLVVATPEAKLGLPEARRGLAAGHAAALLAFRGGAGLASRVALTGEPLDADSARTAGIFHEIVPERQLWVRAHALSESIAKSAPEAVAMTKRLLNETIGEDVLTWLAAGSAMTATARTTEAARNGVQAFLDKTDPPAS